MVNDACGTSLSLLGRINIDFLPLQISYINPVGQIRLFSLLDLSLIPRWFIELREFKISLTDPRKILTRQSLVNPFPRVFILIFFSYFCPSTFRLYQFDVLNIFDKL